MHCVALAAWLNERKCRLSPSSFNLRMGNKRTRRKFKIADTRTDNKLFEARMLASSTASQLCTGCSCCKKQVSRSYAAAGRVSLQAYCVRLARVATYVLTRC